MVQLSAHDIERPFDPLFYRGVSQACIDRMLAVLKTR
jgi:hypothetical protein